MQAGDGSPNLEQLLQMGIRTAREGNPSSARLMFEQVLAKNDQDERAWLWMASIADDETEKRRYLETVLRINPDNAMAKNALGAMENKRTQLETRTLRLGMAVVAVLVVLVVLALVVVFLASRP